MAAAIEPPLRRTTADLVADTIRERIIAGRFVPGTQLGEVQLAEQLDVSRGPVREALQRLIQEGLLESRPYRGVFVVELGLGDILDVYRVRGTLERAAADALVAGSDPTALEDLERLVERMARAAARDRWTTLTRLDRAFHERLVAGAGSPRLVRAYRTVSAETAICMAGLADAYQARQDMVEEHRELLGALRTGHAATAHQAIDAHLEHTVRHLTARVGLVG